MVKEKFASASSFQLSNTGVSNLTFSISAKPDSISRLGRLSSSPDTNSPRYSLQDLMSYINSKNNKIKSPKKIASKKNVLGRAFNTEQNDVEWNLLYEDPDELGFDNVLTVYSALTKEEILIKMEKTAVSNSEYFDIFFIDADQDASTGIMPQMEFEISGWNLGVEYAIILSSLGDEFPPTGLYYLYDYNDGVVFAGELTTILNHESSNQILLTPRRGIGDPHKSQTHPPDGTKTTKTLRCWHSRHHYLADSHPNSHRGP